MNNNFTILIKKHYKQYHYINIKLPIVPYIQHCILNTYNYVRITICTWKYIVSLDEVWFKMFDTYSGCFCNLGVFIW